MKAEKPLFVYEDDWQLSAFKRTTQLKDKLLALDDEGWNAFWGLSNCFDGRKSGYNVPERRKGDVEEVEMSRARGIFVTNCLHLTEDVGGYGFLTSWLRIKSVRLEKRWGTGGDEKGETNGERQTKSLQTLGIFPMISRSNHACIPNAKLSWHVRSFVVRG